MKKREEAEARQRAKEAREKLEARRLEEQEEREARERAAERAREEKLQSVRRGWARLRDTGWSRRTRRKEERCGICYLFSLIFSVAEE